MKTLLVAGILFQTSAAEAVWNVDKIVSVPVTAERLECADLGSSGSRFSSNIKFIWPEYANEGGLVTYYADYGLHAANEPRSQCQNLAAALLKQAGQNNGRLDAHLVATRDSRWIEHCDISNGYGDDCRNPRQIKVLWEEMTLTFPGGLRFGTEGSLRTAP